MADSSKGMIDVAEWEAKSLIGHSYDVVFSVQSRVKKISEWHLWGAGLTYSQMAAFFAVLLADMVAFAFVVGPLSRLLFGGNPTWWMILLIIFGPAVLATMKVTKPLPFKKTISSYLTSLYRYHTDEVVHRRGRPVRTVDDGAASIMYQRVWEPAPEFSDLFQQLPISDPATERRFSGLVVDADPWLAGQEAENAAERAQAAHEANQKQRPDRQRGYSRGDTGVKIRR